MYTYIDETGALYFEMSGGAYLEMDQKETMHLVHYVYKHASGDKKKERSSVHTSVQ